MECPNIFQNFRFALASPMLPPRLLLTGNAAAYQAYLEKAGYTGGVEWHPLRIARLYHEVGRHAFEPGEAGEEPVLPIRSVHQSFVSTAPGMMPHSTPHEVALSTKAVLALRTAQGSLRWSSQHRDQLGDVPVVLYPEVGCSNIADLPYSKRLFQPNIRVNQRWGVTSTAELIERALAEGYTGIAWDSYHYQRTAEGGRVRMENWDKALSQFLGGTALPIEEMHIAIGRTDRTEDTELMEATREELGIFLEEPQKIGETTTGQMMRIIHDAYNGTMRYVVEAELTPDNLPSGMSTLEAHQALTSNVTSFLD